MKLQQLVNCLNKAISVGAPLDSDLRDITITKMDDNIEIVDIYTQRGSNTYRIHADYKTPMEDIK